jgi:uncharacterized damage-inducible protein DinB
LRLTVRDVRLQPDPGGVNEAGRRSGEDAGITARGHRRGSRRHTDEDLDYRISDDAKSLREIALHIAQVSAGLVDEILKTDGSLVNLFSPDIQVGLQARIPPAATKAELIERLTTTGEQNAARLREAGERLLTETMPTLGGGTQTRLSAAWFVVAHEMYHRGQLAIYGRGCGVVPALTQRLNALLASR